MSFFLELGFIELELEWSCGEEVWGDGVEFEEREMMNGFFLFLFWLILFICLIICVF